MFAWGNDYNTSLKGAALWAKFKQLLFGQNVAVICGVEDEFAASE